MFMTMLADCISILQRAKKTPEKKKWETFFMSHREFIHGPNDTFERKDTHVILGKTKRKGRVSYE